MTKSKYHPELVITSCPNCNSTSVQEGGDDFDGDVSCNDCSLTTPNFRGTKAAINAWNKRLYMDKWIFLNPDNDQFDYQI